MFLILCTFFIQHNNYIYGYGIAVTSEQFPFQASLRFYYNHDHHCSGTILNNKYILTAGHCICNYVKYTLLYVVVGANSFASPGYNYAIKKGICHADYVSNFLQNDIALLKIMGKIHYNRRVQPISLIHFGIPKSAVLLMSVWRYKKEHIKPPTHFKLCPVTVIGLNKCRNFFAENMINEQNICTLSRSGMGACIGDSGGPVVYKTHLVGIISFGKECTLNFPDVLTNISYYKNWISERISLKLLDVLNKF